MNRIKKRLITLASLSALGAGALVIAAPSVQAQGTWSGWVPRGSYASCTDDGAEGWSLAERRKLWAFSGSGDGCSATLAIGWPRGATGQFVHVTSGSYFEDETQSASVASPWDLTHSQCAVQNQYCPH